MTSAGPALVVDGLRTEAQIDPLGLDAKNPRFSWRIHSQSRAVRQAAYELRVATSERSLVEHEALVWTSGQVASDQSTQVQYAGPPARSREQFHWQVRIWDQGGRPSDWSVPATWEMGLLSPEDWSAHWIEPELSEEDGLSNPAPFVRRQFRLVGDIVQARAYVTSRGLYELHLNGRRVGDWLFTPGWTSYHKRLQYQTYDVTALVREGDNAVGAILGDGWYRGAIGFAGQRNFYGRRLALLAQIEVTYGDGRRELITSDATWKTATGPIIASDLYNGETYDARLEHPGWAEPHFDDRDWSSVTIAAPSHVQLVAQVGPPVRRIAEISPVNIVQTPCGETVADLGQNLTGWVRLKASGQRGTRISLRHAEVLDGAGNFYTENLRSAEAKVQYTLKGSGDEIFEPHFTFHGFRYVAVEGFPGALQLQDLTAIVIHSDLAVAGEFVTSNPQLNQLQHNIVWGQRGNFLDVPTDCPQRDERLGWTGDAQAFCATAAFNMDVERFFGKWLADVAVEQYPNGAVPWVVPDVLVTLPKSLLYPQQPGMMPAGGTAGWSDAVTIVPWTLYLAYSDTQILRTQYPSMRRWVQYQQSRAGADHIPRSEFEFGDWLDLFSTAEGSNFGSTSTTLIATAFYARSVDILQRSAKLLDKAEDAQRYGDLSRDIRQAFNEHFVSSDGRVGEGTQTAYVLALDFDLLPEKIRPIAACHLANDVRARGHLTTGFLGTPHLLHALSRFGYLDEAYVLLSRQEYPSWLYPVSRGATTIWERWDGIKPDGSFQDKSMNSFNHYAYGAVGEWMYRVIGGINIDPLNPGYKHVIIKPHPGGGLTQVEASHHGPFGLVRSLWRCDGTQFSLVLDIPPNSTASVHLPHALLAEVRESGASLSEGDGIFVARQIESDVVVNVGSGHYKFVYPWAT